MDAQTLPRPIQEGDLERYEQWAIEHAAYIKAGDINWPMMVRSLVEEVRRFQVVVTENEASEDAMRDHFLGLPS